MSSGAAGVELGAGRGHDLRGIRFGELEPLRVVRKQHLGNKWLCLCRCGRHCQRLAASLWYALTHNQTPMCRACSYRRLGRRANNRRREKYLVLWQHEGALYTEHAERHDANVIRREISERLGIDEPHNDDAPALPVWGLQLADAIDQLEHEPRRRARATAKARRTAEQIETLAYRDRQRAAELRAEREQWAAWEAREAASRKYEAERHARTAVPPPAGKVQTFEEACAAANEWMRRSGVLTP